MPQIIFCNLWLMVNKSIGNTRKNLRNAGRYEPYLFEWALRKYTFLTNISQVRLIRKCRLKFHTNKCRKVANGPLPRRVFNICLCISLRRAGYRLPSKYIFSWLNILSYFFCLLHFICSRIY